MWFASSLYKSSALSVIFATDKDKFVSLKCGLSEQTVKGGRIVMFLLLACYCCSCCYCCCIFVCRK